MSEPAAQDEPGTGWPTVGNAALRIAFGIIWAVGAAFTWTSQFADNYAGYLHNAALGQPAWSSWWFDMWIAVVTPHAAVFVWLTRAAETALALALLFGIARKTAYVLGALFSLLIWSTAGGFGGPYAVGAANTGTSIAYVLIFVALIGINYRGGPSPYSIDHVIERHWPGWARIAEWSGDFHLRAPRPNSVAAQVTAMAAIALLVFFLIGGLHSTTHVAAPTPAAAAAAVSPLSLAKSGKLPPADVHDARLPPLIGTSSDVDVHLVVTDDAVTIANGVTYQAWTFGGTVPGPVIHVRQGQTVHFTLTNHGLMDHSIDFHAAQVAPSKDFADIKPGKSISFTFTAEVPGAFVYHCGTAPVLLHMGNGMYGVIVVSPKDPLPPAAQSYVIAQSEWYTQQVAGTLMAGDYQKMLAERPDEVVFNGVANQYVDHPLPATVGKVVRIYFVNAGPNAWSSFHVIGAVFHKVYEDGDMTHPLTNVSAYTVGPGAGAIFDVVMQQPGKYSFVDHDFAHLMIGAHGVFDARPEGAEPAPIVGMTSAQRSAPPASASASAAPAPAAPTRPYTFDAAKGAALYTANCAACHQATGMGLPGAFPPLKGDPVVLSADPREQISTILHGAHGRNIGGQTYASAMPPFASSLSDTDIANIVNHERTSWGNHAKQVTADEVKAVRAAGPAASH